MNHSDYMSNVFFFQFQSHMAHIKIISDASGSRHSHWWHVRSLSLSSAYHCDDCVMMFQTDSRAAWERQSCFSSPEVSHTPAGWFASNFRVLSVRALALHWKSLGIELLSPSLAVTSSEGGWRKKGRQNASPLTSPLQTPRFLQYPAGSPSIQLSSDLPPPFTPTPA